MRTCFLALLTLVAACGASVQSDSTRSQVTLAVEPDNTAPGGTVDLVLSNQSEDTIGYNLCASGLERRQAGDWQILPSDRVCTMELRILDPGAQTRYPISLPDTLSPGQYRYSTSINYMEAGGSEGVPSEPFTVAG